MRILVCDEWVPFPLDGGKKLRTYNIISRLARTHQVVYLCFCATREEKASADLLARRLGMRFVLVKDERGPKGTASYLLRVFLNLFSSRPFSAVYHFTDSYAHALSALISEEKFDLLICEWTFLARYFDLTVNVPRVLMAHNVERHFWERFAKCSPNPVKKIFGTLQAAKVRRFEARFCPEFDHCVAVSNSDRNVFLSSYGLRSVSIAENGVDLGYFKPSDTVPDPNRIVFTGSMDYFANEDAVLFFLREILPIVRQKNPSATFWVVGRSPSKKLISVARSYRGVTVTGTVPDVRTYVWMSGVYVAPLRIGGGTRLKILEAMAMGKAVVSTTVGAEGLCVADGAELLLADTPKEFARTILALQEDETRRRALGEKARQKVEAKYGWDPIVKSLEATLLTVAANHRSPRADRLRVASRGQLSDCGQA